MIAKVIAAKNLAEACKKVVQSRGSAVVDGMFTLPYAEILPKNAVLM